jgi:hypothetical protein
MRRYSESWLRRAASHGDLYLLAAGPHAQHGRTEWNLRFDVHREAAAGIL